MKHFVRAVFVLLLFCFVYGSSISEAKEVKVPLGKWYITTYSARDNTPAGSHDTSSGAYATAGRTCAVDYCNPLVPMGSIIEIEGIGRREVQDYGGFGRYNNGRRAVDVFKEDHEPGYLVNREVYLIREETEEERIAREEAEEKKARDIRESLQDDEFTLEYSPCLLVGEMIADEDIIPKGTAIVNWHKDKFVQYQYLEVTQTQKGLGHKILIGDLRKVLEYKTITFQEVIEEAVG